MLVPETDAHLSDRQLLRVIGQEFSRPLRLLIGFLPILSVTATRQVLDGTGLSTAPSHLPANVRALRLAALALSVGTLTATAYATELSEGLVLTGALITCGLLGAAAIIRVRR